MSKRKPSLQRVSITIRCTEKDLRQFSLTLSNIGRMGLQPAPEKPIYEALRELGRLIGRLSLSSTEARAALSRGVTIGTGERAAAGGYIRSFPADDDLE